MTFEELVDSIPALLDDPEMLAMVTRLRRMSANAELIDKLVGHVVLTLLTDSKDPAIEEGLGAIRWTAAAIVALADNKPHEWERCIATAMTYHERLDALHKEQP